MISKEIEKQKALKLRKLGHSYSQIKNSVSVSKSTLSLWLKEFPLSKSQIDLLRGKNPQRIERFRNTMKAKKDNEEQIAGLYLYWGEGTKTASCTVAVTNTDPDVLRFFLKWLDLFGVDTSKLRVVLHLYKDMDIQKETKFWSLYLKIPLSQFRKPYIKNTRFCDITYRSGFGHGTCSVLYLDKELYLFVKSGLKYIRMRA